METLSGVPVLDRVEGLRRVAGDAALYAELLGVFMRDLPRLLGLIDTGLATHSPELQCAAHSLKGSAHQIGAKSLAAEAALLEDTARRAAWTEAHLARQRLDLALRELAETLEATAAMQNGGTRDEDSGRG